MDQGDAPGAPVANEAGCFPGLVQQVPKRERVLGGGGIEGIAAEDLDQFGRRPRRLVDMDGLARDDGQRPRADGLDALFERVGLDRLDTLKEPITFQFT